MEFNVSLPCGANASIAPVSTLTVTQRWAKVVNVSTTGTEYVQVTKFDVIHNIQYTDCKGNVRVSTESTSTIMETAATSETITTLTPTVTKVIDVIIPNGVSIVSQQVLDELPTSLPVKGHCAYSVFDVRVTPAPAPTAAIASVAKSKITCLDNHSVVTTRIYRTITCNNYKRCNKLNKHSRRPNLF
jgi:hypothetical protein